MDPYGGRRLCSGVGSEATTEEGIVSREKAEAGWQDDRRAVEGFFPHLRRGRTSVLSGEC